MCLRWAAANWKTARGPRGSPKVENEDDDEQPQPTTANRQRRTPKRQTPNAKRDALPLPNVRHVHVLKNARVVWNMK
jgi:hypothetical protein